MSITRIFGTGAWTSGVVLAASMAFAQTPPTTQPASPQTPSTPSTSSPTTSGDQSTSSSYGSPVTITGCVQRADSSASGTGGSGFVLKSTGSGSSSSSPSSGSPTSSSTPSSTGSPSSPSSTTGQEYQLMAGSSSVQLADHVGHQVEVTGTMGSGASPSSSGTTGSTSGTGTSSTTPSQPGSTQPGQATSPAASSMSAGSTFNVTSVRMVSASCPQ